MVLRFLSTTDSGFVVLGAVSWPSLVAKAYADIGHTTPCLTWFVTVLPALTLNYLGRERFCLLNQIGGESLYRMALVGPSAGHARHRSGGHCFAGDQRGLFSDHAGDPTSAISCA
jgi:hypothetical protein